MYGDNFTLFGECMLQWVEMYPWTDRGNAETACRLLQNIFEERNVRLGLTEKLEALRSKLEARLPDNSEGAIRIHKGALVIDATSRLPNIKEAREAAERYVFKTALQLTDGNVSAAARLIGLSRNEAFYLNKILQGELPRPSRAKSQNGNAPNPPRRRT